MNFPIIFFLLFIKCKDSQIISIYTFLKVLFFLLSLFLINVGKYNIYKIICDVRNLYRVI